MTKHEYSQLLMQLLTPTLPFYSPQKARLCPGSSAAVYDMAAAGAEGFARPLWGLVPFWAGGGSCPEFEQLYLSGLAAGTDPENPEYWGGFQDIDQRFVEMAAIAYGILMTPQKLWDPLSAKEKTNLAKWLDGINHYACPPCNWMFFGVLVNIALKSVGFPYSEQVLSDYLDYIESCYLGGGWYLDGQNGEKDYYISFAFHYYSMIYCRFMRENDPDRCALYEERAKLFAADFINWFAEDGSALAYGRSLTYRFAQVSFFSMCAACELEVVPYGIMKGLIERHLRFWTEHPIVDNSGLLTIGYGYSNLLMSEQYNAPGSPYWAMKAFAFLSLPDEHPFWKTEAAPLPDLPTLTAQTYGGLLIQRLHGDVTAYTCGRTLPHHHVLTEEKYSKFSYSSRFAFSVPRSMRSLAEAAPDSMLALDINHMIYVRGMVSNPQLTDHSVSSEWSPYEGIRIKTVIIPDSTGHKRIHTIESDRCFTAYDCSFAFPDTYTVSQEQSCIRVQAPDGRAYCASAVKDDPAAMCINASPNTNLMVPKTIIPCICYEIQKGTQVIETRFWEE